MSKSKVVLVVDDDETSRDQLAMVLRLSGHKAITAGNGHDAWTILDIVRLSPDYIISDYNMPIVDGLELLRRVRADNRTTNIPFILMSGGVFVSEEDKTPLEVVVKDLGADFWERPCDFFTLVEKLLSGDKGGGGGQWLRMAQMLYLKQL